MLVILCDFLFFYRGPFHAFSTFKTVNSYDFLFIYFFKQYVRNVGSY